MAAMFGSVCGTVTLLMCVLGGQALDLLRATATSGNPSSIPMVHCWCASYPNLTLCSWPEPALSPPTHYIATYSERHNQLATRQCHLTPPNSSSLALNSSSSEPLWHCHLPNLKLLTDYIINVTAVHSGGSSSQLASFMLEDIVKPDPPVDVRVSPHNIRNLLVEWSPPPTWANLDIFPLKYQIMYQWENRGTPKFVSLGPFENTRVELRGLTPGKVYQFQVCAKELLGLGECSNWSSPVNITIPRRKP
ncbi:LOW QUALITY PROTEIN: interleukin-27 subunit beta [Lates calcarifer]|uniref:LOW QUALITY PROTEIN: interleukin-27 subunit beta n=1 Tax=Lates calcarifer TaxID=8187 RepID=A0AAJ8BJQ6_LATCA|nr:LOW QUALITY PROTEIN: interleukin-27 subunit beta [Lates calcarifer]